MSSILPGYKYDIFISYRQKDNKYDGWVTEFVDNLMRELESTFKEDVSVYFDINPHDGLLENHDVNDSLKEKLNSLIFIPIISRTYCDPNSFAWDHEFKAFIENASKDRYGLKVKLPNGNVANRVLPVRIHDLDISDIKLCESIIGSVLRGVDFIYKSTGVNRPLRSKEDNPHDNLNHTIYRDQINKVALAVRDIIENLRLLAISDQVKDKEIQIKEDVKKKEIIINVPIRKIKGKSKQKVKDINYKPDRTGRLPYLLTKPLILISGALILVTSFILLWVGIRLFNKNKKIQWAHHVQIPAIQKLINENFIVPSKAFDVAMELEKIIPGDSELVKLWPKVASVFPYDTKPSGADVFWKDYNEPAGEWKLVGTTPIKNARFPICFIRLKIEKKGFQTIWYAGPSLWYDLKSEISNLKLDSTGTLPENMVRIPPKQGKMIINGLDALEEKPVGEFLADRFEVTNEEYKRFLDYGGYNNKSYWIHPIYKDGKVISWENAMNLFVDKTGRRGPAGWEMGNYPDEEKNYPVTGISWYEAAAYASFMGKMLPTVYHWCLLAETTRSSDIIPKSNFNNRSPVPVGTMEGISAYGIYDIAGNVREWCFNKGETYEESFVLGGGWNDPTYTFNDSGTQLSLDRSMSNGFRCIKVLPGDTTLSALTVPIKRDIRDYYKEKPVDDQTFSQFLKQFLYDKSPLNTKRTELNEPGIWKVEKATIDAGYNNERLDIWICLPKDTPPSFQPVIFFPGANAIFTDKFYLDDFKWMEFVVKSGRALVFPILKGTYNRRDGLNSDYPKETVFYKDHVIMWRRDIGRTLDYLETREDIQAEKAVFFGVSWGGFLGGIIPAVEKRVKVVVLYVGGMEMPKTFPEVDQINFLPRIKQPILMLNGKYDMFFPEETSQKPMFKLLGTPSKDKKIFVYETGHVVPRTDMIRETLAWLDKYLGPAKQ